MELTFMGVHEHPEHPCSSYTYMLYIFHGCQGSYKFEIIEGNV